MRPGERLPLLTQVLEIPAPEGAAAAEAAASGLGVAPCEGDAAAHAAPRTSAAELLPVSEQMARAVLELELEQALREVLEPRLSVLLRETASELAVRLEPRMREWLRERGS